MKRSALLFNIFAVSALLLFAQPALAEVSVSVSGNEGSSNVSVQQESSGQSTTCINGECTTTGGSGKATVCINGECTTSDDGSIKIQSDDGSTKVDISNDVSVSSDEPSSMEEKEAVTEPTITPDPVMEQKMDSLDQEIEDTTERIKERVKSEESVLMSFIKEELESLQKFINSLFS